MRHKKSQNQATVKRQSNQQNQTQICTIDVGSIQQRIKNNHHQYGKSSKGKGDQHADQISNSAEIKI